MVEANQEQDLNAAGSEERPQRPPAPDYDFTDDMANPATGALGTNKAAGFRRNQVVFFQEQVSNLNKALECAEEEAQDARDMLSQWEEKNRAFQKKLKKNSLEIFG